MNIFGSPQVFMLNKIFYEVPLSWYQRGTKTKKKLPVLGEKTVLCKFQEKFLFKDIHGNPIYDGDEIQGYSNSSGKVLTMYVTYPQFYEEVLENKFKLHSDKKTSWMWLIKENLK